MDVNYYYQYTKTYLPEVCCVPEFKLSPSDTCFSEFSLIAALSLNELHRELSFPDVYPPKKVQKALTKAYSSLSAIREVLKSEIGALVSNRLTHSLVDYNPEDKFDQYDEYFNIVRYKGNDPLTYLLTVVCVCSDQLFEILHSQINLTEMVAGIKGMCLLFDIVLSDADKSGITVKAITPQSLPTLEIVDLQSATDKALKRWKVGHAFFAIMLHFSTTQLMKAVNNASHLQNAAIFFRSSTSAMCYSAGFSSQMYLQFIRPSMINPQTPHGFSGTQNRDFQAWRKAKNVMVQYYQNKASLTEEERNYLLAFADAYLSDIEIHIYIASSMVADLTSLMQEKVNQIYNLNSNESAVDMLRAILKTREEEFYFIKKN